MREFYIRTPMWAIVRYHYNTRRKVWVGEVFGASPGSSAKQAWILACNAIGTTREQLRDGGWSAQRLVITGQQ